MNAVLLMATLLLSGLGTATTAVVKTDLPMSGARGNYERGIIHSPKVPHEKQKIYRYPRSPEDEENVAQSEPSNKEPDTKPENEATTAEPGDKTTSEPAPESEFANSSAETPPKTSKAEASPETWPEAGPRWTEAFKTWSWCWELHVYLFATLYLLIGLYGGYYVLINVYDGLVGKFLSVSLNVMVLVFGLTRAFVLYIDPYHQGGMHIKALVFMRVLWSIGGPCLTAADSAIILALVELAQVNIAPPRLQKLKTVSTIVAVHFGFVVLTDWIVSSYVDAKAMLLFCQVFYVVWGSVLGTGYIRLGLVLDRKLFLHKNKDKADKIYLGLIYLSGAANYFLCGIVFYSSFSVFGVYSDIDFVDAWHWWILQTLYRVSEVITCVLIFTVSAKRLQVDNREAQDVNPVAPTLTPTTWVGPKDESTKEQIQLGSKRKTSFFHTLANHLQTYYERWFALNRNKVAGENTCVMRESGEPYEIAKDSTVDLDQRSRRSLALSARGVGEFRAHGEAGDGSQDFSQSKFRTDESAIGKLTEKPARRMAPRSRRRMSMFSALQNHTNGQSMMEWKGKNGRGNENQASSEVTGSRAAFIVLDEDREKDEDVESDLTFSRPRQNSMSDSTLHDVITKLDSQQRPNDDDEAISRLEDAFVTLNGCHEENGVEQSQIGIVPKRDVRKIISEVNKAFAGIDETEEDIVTVRRTQSNLSRRNSLFSALQEQKVEAANEAI